MSNPPQPPHDAGGPDPSGSGYGQPQYGGPQYPQYPQQPQYGQPQYGQPSRPPTPTTVSVAAIGMFALAALAILKIIVTFASVDAEVAESDSKLRAPPSPRRQSTR